MPRLLKCTGVALSAVLVLFVSGSAPAALIGVINQLSIPIVNFDQTGSTVIVSGDMTVKMNSTVFLLPGPTVVPVLPPTTQTDPNFDTILRVSLDASCNLLSGVTGDDFALEGKVDLGGGDVRDGVLLTGEVAESGFLDGATTDIFDYRINVTGGLMADFYTNEDFGLQVTSEGSDFAADCGNGVVTTGGAKGSGGAFPPPMPAQGCTPGYWKQKHHFDSWDATPYLPTDTVASVYGPLDPTIDDLELKEALKLGGGGLKALIRHSVAALLNASHSDVNSTLTVAQVISDTQAAVASGDYEPTKNAFEAANEEGCPLN